MMIRKTSKNVVDELKNETMYRIFIEEMIGRIVAMCTAWYHHLLA